MSTDRRSHECECGTQDCVRHTAGEAEWLT
jgi:hypothetical protein